MGITILGIESSCDETSAAVVRNNQLLSNVIASQEVHEKYGGVVPELASRAHQQNIVPIIDQALKQAQVSPEQLDAIAFTRGPGLLGALLVGTSFAKGFALALNKPLIEINHLQGHVLTHFISESESHVMPEFPFLSLIVSGGHTQLVIVRDHLEYEVVGSTIDDAAGEAFDKCAKVMGLSYPGGPIIDRNAALGNRKAFSFPRPDIRELDFSFSGLKTSFLYFLRDGIKSDPDFIQKNMMDLCASLQHTIVEILIDKVAAAMSRFKINTVSIGGGVAANSGLRNSLTEFATNHGYHLFLPPLKYTTDNAAMIAVAAYYKYLNKEFTDQSVTPLARMNL